MKLTSDSQSIDVAEFGHGFEFLTLQGGVDRRVVPGLALGAFLSFSFGQYRSASGSCTGDCTGVTILSDGDIPDKAFHEWFGLGMRGTFVIGGSNELESSASNSRIER